MLKELGGHCLDLRKTLATDLGYDISTVSRFIKEARQRVYFRRRRSGLADEARRAQAALGSLRGTKTDAAEKMLLRLL